MGRRAFAIFVFLLIALSVGAPAALAGAVVTAGSSGTRAA